MIKQVAVKEMAFSGAFYYYRNVPNVTALPKRSYPLLFIK
jgi:hypothetical protein